MISGTQARFSANVALQSALSGQIATLQDQVSTGKRIARPSDDPLANAQVDVIRERQANDTAYQANAVSASATATRVDSAMSSLSSSFTQALSLVTQGASGTAGADARAVIATQLRGLAAGITQLAAQKDTNGQALFPEGQAPKVPLADGLAIDPSVSRAALFSTTDADGTTTDMADLLSAAADAIGGASDATASAVSQPFLSAIQAASDHAAAVHAEQGVRAARIDARADALATDQVDLATARSGLEDTDLSAAISTITAKMTTLQAAQAVFAKVSSRTLFDALG